jgi:hypothetical protein
VVIERGSSIRRQHPLDHHRNAEEKKDENDGATPKPQTAIPPTTPKPLTAIPRITPKPQTCENQNKILETETHPDDADSDAGSAVPGEEDAVGALDEAEAGLVHSSGQLLSNWHA